MKFTVAAERGSYLKEDFTSYVLVPQGEAVQHRQGARVHPAQAAVQDGGHGDRQERPRLHLGVEGQPRARPHIWPCESAKLGLFRHYHSLPISSFFRATSSDCGTSPRPSDTATAPPSDTSTWTTRGASRPSTASELTLPSRRCSCSKSSRPSRWTSTRSPWRPSLRSSSTWDGFII